MKNSCLQAVLNELRKAGVAYRVDDRGKHISVRIGEGLRRRLIVSRTPSDQRAGLKARAFVRRVLREMTQ